MNKTSDSVGSWATVGNLTLNGNAGTRVVPPGTYGNFIANGQTGLTLGIAGATQPAIYNFQALTLNGQTTVSIVGPVIVTTASGFNANGQVGVSGHADWLQLRIATGGVTLNGGSTMHGSILAPNGTVIVNGQSILCGTAACDRFTLNGGGLVRWCNTQAGDGNRPPTAQPQNFTTAEDRGIPIVLTGSDLDGNTLAFTVSTPPAHGSLSGAPPNLTYTPVANYHGPDSFAFTAYDGAVASSPATVSITVTPGNDAPTANSQTIATTEDTPFIVTLTGSDVDGDTLSYTIVGTPLRGTVEKDTSAGAGAGDFFFVPAPNSNAPDAFTFRVQDGRGGAADAIVQVTITPVDDVSVATPLSVVVDEDGEAPVTLVGVDPDGELLSYEIVAGSGPAHGVLAGAAPDFIYRPAANYHGADAFSYIVVDASGDRSAPGVVSIQVRPIDDRPVAQPAVVDTLEDTAVSLTVTASDVDEEALAYEVLTAPQHGVLSGTGPTFVYTPAANFFGEDSFTFRAVDQANPVALESTAATVTLRVASVNDAPIAQAEGVITSEDTLVSIRLTGSDVDGDPLTIIAPTAPGEMPQHGSLAPTEDPAVFLYTPAANYGGSDSFRFKVRDGQIESALAEVQIVVQPINDIPVAAPITLVIGEDQPASLTLTGVDIDDFELFFEVVAGSGPNHGTLSGTAPAVVYHPAANFFGSDQFDYLAIDSLDLESAPARVSITVQPRNDAPVAENRALDTSEDTAVNVTLAATDVENDPLTFAIITPPAHGTLEEVAPREFRYQPNANFHGSDGFVYVSRDGELESASATVTIAVTPVNDAPVAAPGNWTTREDTSLSISLQAADIDGDTLSYVPGTPAHGTLVAGPDPSTFIYTPTADFRGTDTFTFVARDGLVASAPAIATITVTPVNDPPVVSAGVDLAVIAPAGVSLQGTASDDGDPSGAPLVLQWQKVSGPGEVTFGDARAAQTAAFYSAAGVYVLRLTANDGELEASDEVQLTVTRPNGPPVVNAGPDARIAPNVSAALAGTATDDGLPIGATLTPTWSKLSGPGTVVFDDAASLTTGATFSAPGDYVLRLLVSDSQFSGSDTVAIAVAAPNQGPVVTAGADQSLDQGTPVVLAGTATDDGLPRGGGLSTTWSKVSGAGNVSFADAFATGTNATFSAPGEYTLRLTANDSELSASDEIVVRIAALTNRGPVVNAGVDQTLARFPTTTLTGVVADDALPAGAALSHIWSKVSGPGEVVFAAAGETSTGVTFGARGVYTLRLTANDTEFSASDDVIVTANSENGAPEVSAGADQSITLPAGATLKGKVTDDGLPSAAALTLIWTKISGPGTATFVNAAVAATSVSFREPATYVLRLAATDTELSANDELTVTVSASPFATRTFTFNTDFDTGQLFNLDHHVADQLQLAQETSGFQFIWVAVSSKGTIVKIDTETGRIMGEYWSSPDGQPKDPSRTTVEYNGGVWASNRAGNSVLHIGLGEHGQWVDRNGNGRLDTSTGLGDIRPWTNANSADTAGGVSTAEDESILHYVRVSSGGTRHVSVNTDNDVWVSGTSGRRFDLIDGVTGIIKRAEASVGFGGYGGLIDRSGVIWLSNPFLRWDTSKPLTGANGVNWKGWSHDSYGLGIDSQGNVWETALFGNAVRKWASDGTLLGTFSHGNAVGGITAQGCAVGKNDDVWVAHSHAGTTVGHLKNDGTYVGNVTVGAGPTGLSVDANGKIWATNFHASTVVRIDPLAGPIGADGVTPVGAVDLTVGPLGGQLYNYSDMTGSTLTGRPLSGRWAVVHDSGSAATEWGAMAWTSKVCGDGDLSVAAASSESPTEFGAGQPVIQGVDLTVPRGRYLQIVVGFQSSSAGDSPVLYDLTVGTKGYAPELPENSRPTISAGPDQNVAWPAAVQLAGSVCDDGLPAGGARTIQWSKLSGPGVITFANDRAFATTATFSEPGVYIVRLEGSDSELSDSGTVRITAGPPNVAPTVSAGALQSVAKAGDTIQLRGWIADDGLPDGGTLTGKWTVVHGPGSVSLGNVNSPETTARFTAPGIYLLKLTATDTVLETSDLIEMRVGVPCHVESPEGIVAWWPGNGHARELINGRNGLIFGGTLFSPGQISLGFDFDGVKDFMQVPSAPVLNVGAGDGLTVEFWIKPEAPNSWQPLLEWNRGSVNEQGAHVWIDGYFQGGRLFVNLIDTTGAAHPHYSNPELLKSGEFQHIAVTYHKASGKLRYYRNGGFFQEVNLGTFTPQTTYDLYVGHRPGANYFDGILDEISIYNRALTTEITAIALETGVGKCPLDNNERPFVDAGPDLAATNLAEPVELKGLVTDDGLPAGSTLRTVWSVVEGPGQVLFADAFDYFDDATNTGFEANTTPWSRATAEQINRKLDQVAIDSALKTTGQVERIIWFGVEELPSSGPGRALKQALEAAEIPYYIITP